MFDDSTIRIILTVMALVLMQPVMAKWKRASRAKLASKRAAEQAKNGGLTNRGQRLAYAGRQCAKGLRALAGQ